MIAPNDFCKSAGAAARRDGSSPDDPVLSARREEIRDGLPQSASAWVEVVAAMDHVAQTS
jgi:hypothetical protein